MRMRDGSELQLLKIADVCGELRISRTTVYKKINTEGFPKPIKFGAKTSVWRSSDVAAWVESRLAA